MPYLLEELVIGLNKMKIGLDGAVEVLVAGKPGPPDALELLQIAAPGFGPVAH